MSAASSTPKGRFAPSPSGRMHLGNIYTALLSWLSVKSRGGTWLLRIEDLDSQRSRREYAEAIEDDLRWLGLDWDEGGLDNRGNRGPYMQSCRHHLYSEHLDRLKHLTYPCFCRRADVMATQAPHRADGRIIYGGTCRPKHLPAPPTTRPHSSRIVVADEDIEFEDMVFGHTSVNLPRECGDFVLQRADGAYAYQLAVVVDDALMGVTEVMRGCDLLLSAAQQIYLFRLLGYTPPEYAHLPLLYSASSGQRLSKRDASLSMEQLRLTHSPEELIGRIALLAGLRDSAAPVSLQELVKKFDIGKIKAVDGIALPG